MTKENSNVGIKIKELRKLRNHSLKDTAESLGLSLSSMSNIENGTQNVKVDLLLKVANFYNVSPASLLEEDFQLVELDDRTVVEDSSQVVSGELMKQMDYLIKGYLKAKTERFKDHEIGGFVRKEMTEILTNELSLNRHYYSVIGSVGQGQWAEVPWIAIFRNKITISAMRGFYIVILFKADMSKFYVSLNQGFSYFKTKYKDKVGRIKAQRIASILRSKLNLVPEHLAETTIDLGSALSLGKGYESGHIFGKSYSIERMPTSSELLNDLSALNLVYKELEGLMRGRTAEEYIDYLLMEDEDEYLEEKSEDNYQEKADEFASSDVELTNLEKNNERRNRPDPVVDEGGKKRWVRNAKVAALALQASRYKCSYNHNHTSFISKRTGKQFMELHHLVPMSFQGDIEVNLDRVANIKSLCPNCHRMIHQGEDTERKVMVESLYRESRDSLEKIGIEITLSQLKKIYGIEK